MELSRSEKILIIHTGGIGDLLLSLPALRIFRGAHRGASLSLLGRPERLALVAFDLQAESIHSIDQAGMAYFYVSGGTLPSRLAAFFASFQTALLVGKETARILAGNLRRTGLDRVILPLFFPPQGDGTHATDLLIRGLEEAGIRGDDSFRPLRLPEEALARAPQILFSLGLLSGEPLLAIHPGSGSPGKNWDPLYFARVADWAGKRSQVLLVSGPAQDGAEEVRRGVKEIPPPVADRLPLVDLAAVLKAATVYLGNDSGITHLAASLGLPTVAIFGPTCPDVWGPRGPNVKILSPKIPSSSRLTKTRPDCSRVCLESILPETVIEVLAPWLP